MNDINKAIKYFRAVKSDVLTDGESFIGINRTADINIAIEALEKQLPKKPIPNEKDTIRFSLCYNCPECGRSFSGTGIADYCYHCGQALNWGDE